jgi:putative transposase
MPFHRLYYHFVWTTSRRAPLITDEIRSLVYQAITEKAQGLGAKVLGIGGIDDHVHFAGALPPTIAPSDFIGDVKGASSYRVNHVPGLDVRIEWQRGFGVLTFSRGHLDRILAYINGQQEHHASAKLWGSLEDCGEDDARKPMMVREDHAAYDPF